MLDLTIGNCQPANHKNWMMAVRHTPLEKIIAILKTAEEFMTIPLAVMLMPQYRPVHQAVIQILQQTLILWGPQAHQPLIYSTTQIQDLPT